MARDRFIWWEKAPSLDSVEKVIYEFIGSFTSIEVERVKNSIFITLDGEPGWNKEHLEKCPYRTERFVEIYVWKDNVDVITRQGDPLVNAVADGLHSYITRRLEGKEDG